MKGDSLTIHVDEGANVRPIHVMARKSGRRAEYRIVNEQKTDWLIVEEVTRGGTIIHQVRIPLSRAVAIVQEHMDGGEPE